MKISYRIHTEEDIDDLIRFVNRNTGWGFDRAAWEHLYLRTPYGDALFALAVIEPAGEIVGQIGFIPSEVLIDGEGEQACRPVAIIIKEELRSDTGGVSFGELLMGMYTLGTDHLRSQGVRLAHIMPEHRWLRLLRMIPGCQIGNFPLYVRPLPMEAPMELPEGYTAENLDSGDPRIDVLWEEASRQYGCIVTRNRCALAWKITLGLFVLIGVSKNGKLAGLFAGNFADRGRRWQICDLLTAEGEESMEATLMAACNAGHQYSSAWPEEHRVMKEISLLATPRMEPALKKLGFMKADYLFGFAVQALDPAVQAGRISPIRWYVSPND